MIAGRINTFTSADLSQSKALQACTELMRGGSKSFFAAARVLPERIRAPATALYAFCRVADDAVDSAPDSASQALALADLQNRLSNIYAGTPLDHVADRALTEVVHTFQIPQPMLAALLEGFEWDAQGRRYHTLDELHEYSARVAGTVGTMMAIIMGVRSEAALARACELGAAMQLTNIARDVGEDARNGRIYLPLSWLRDAGINPQEWLAAPVFDERLGKIVERLLLEADRLYTRAEAGISELPRDCRMAIQAARLLYAEIGNEVRRQGLDSISKRAIVSSARKVALLALASGKAIDFVPRFNTLTYEPTLAEFQFLITAGLNTAQAQATSVPPSLAQTLVREGDGFLPASDKRSFYHRTVWVIDLCERLAQRERTAHYSAMARTADYKSI